MRLLSLLLLAVSVYGMDSRVSSYRYLTVNSGGVVYVPTWARYDVNHNYNIPAGYEILYDFLNTSTLHYELWACQGAPGISAANVCSVGSQQCLSCAAAFKTAVWGGLSLTAGRAVWSTDGNYVVFSAQDATSTLAGYGIPAGGVSTADPGIGSQHNIWVMDRTFTKFWQITSSTCSTNCLGPDPGMSANGTRTVPIDSTGAGGWFPDFSPDGHKIVWSNNLCVATVVGVNNCTGIVLGTEIEIIDWSPGATFPATATVNSVNFSAPFGVGGRTCVASACTNNQPQYFYEMEHFHPTDSTKFTFAAADHIQTGNLGEVSLSGGGSARALMPVCPGPFLDTTLCHWTEHSEYSSDGQRIALSTTKDTGPINGNATASPIYAAFGNALSAYPPYQEIDMIEPHNTNGIGRYKLTGFNDPTQPEFVNASCHIRFASVVFSPDNKFLLLNNMEDAGATSCPGGHGITFSLLSLQTKSEMFGNTQMTVGTSIQ